MTGTAQHNKEESDEIDLMDIFLKLWNGRKVIFNCMGVFFALGIVLIIASPKEYKSEVILLVETGSGTSAMSGLLQQFGGLAGLSLGTTAMEDALTPELYPDIIKSTPFLLEVTEQKVIESKYDSTLKVTEYIQRHVRPGIGSLVIKYTIGLPWQVIGKIKSKPSLVEKKMGDNKPAPLKLTFSQSKVLGELTKRIEAKPGKSSTTLDISVEMQDPVVAAQLVDSVVSTLTKYIVEYRTQKAKTDLSFVEERHKEAEEKYRIAQRNLAAYKDRNKNVILASALTSEQNFQAEYNLAFNIYNTLSQQLEQSKMKVQENTPVFKVVEPAKVALNKSKPRSLFVLSGMIIIGGFLGVGILFGRILKHQIFNND